MNGGPSGPEAGGAELPPEHAPAPAPDAAETFPPPSGPPITPSAPQTGRRRLPIIGAGVLALVVGVVAAYLIGHSAGDNSSQVAALRSSVTNLQSQTDALSQTIGTLDDQVLSAAATTDTTSTDFTSTDNAASSGATGPLHHIGNPATVGTLIIKPTAFTKSQSGAQTVYTVTIQVKNIGSSSVEVFCGDSGASLIDDQGRTFDTKSVLNERGSVNCGDNIQPGLSKGPYLMDFTVPPGTHPKVLTLSGTLDNTSQAASWTVG